MTFTRSVSTGNYGPCKFIVDGTTTANGTHSTIAAALTSASSGDTIFIRSGTYTENLTLKAGVNLVAFDTDALTPNVKIVGKATFSAAGTCSISGIRLQTNSDFAIAVTDSNGSTLRLSNCWISCSNNTGISTTGTAICVLWSCIASIETTGIGLYSSSSSGSINIYNSLIQNSGNSVTASSNSAGAVTFINSCANIVFSTSSTGTFTAQNSQIDVVALNTTSFTSAGTGSSGLLNCYLTSGTASAVSVGAGTTVTMSECSVSSSNTNAITGAGTVIFGDITFVGTSSLINTTTQTRRNTAIGLEAAWTPTDASGAGLTFSTATGSYIRIGNLVIASCIVVYPATVDGSAAIIGGLPFTPVTGNQYRAGTVTYTSVGTLARALTTSGTAQFQLYTATATNITNAVMTLSTNFFQIIYQAV